MNGTVNKTIPLRAGIQGHLMVWLTIVPLIACGGDELPSVADFGRPDFRVEFDSSGNNQSQCVQQTEVCNGRDDDCDGAIDEERDVRIQVFADPDHCGACNRRCDGPNARFACQVGQCVVAACDPGFIDYNGEPEDGCEADCVITAGGQELCDDIDNDCDGTIDEDFDLENDPQNCGACQRVCNAIANGLSGCVSGGCEIERCDQNWHDLNSDISDGCEYSCTERIGTTASEFCNGLDDDCDGQVDETMGMQQPPIQCGIEGACRFDCVSEQGCADDEICNDGRICVPAVPVEMTCADDGDCQEIHPGLACISTTRRLGNDRVTEQRCVERSHEPMCDGAQGFRCIYSLDYQRADESGRCDGIDNDCDGRTDEDFIDELFLADRQTQRPCSSGQGVCRRNGVVTCGPNGERTICNAPIVPAQTNLDTECDAIDQDCDGLVDEDFDDAVVAIDNIEIFAYEASRPGASAELRGLDPNPNDGIETFIESRACSRPGVLPWDDATWSEAAEACAQADARLCTGDEFARACGGVQTQLYPYGNSFRSLLCNGQTYDTDDEQPGVQSQALACGAMERCQRDGVFDLSGNLKEWVIDSIGNLRAVRGGSYATVLGGGLACDQDGDWKDRNFHHRSIGFRCCRDR
ncbi:MAG: MopE-related protein [Myxococcota bacterium]|nr:MopE-related protein [Myxococcota bacterium]